MYIDRINFTAQTVPGDVSNWNYYRHYESYAETLSMSIYV